MNTIVLTDLLTGLWDKGPDYVLVAVIIAAFFFLRDIYLFNRRQALVNAKLFETQNVHDKKLDKIETVLEEFREFRKEMRADHEEFRGIFKKHDEYFIGIQYSFKDLRKDVSELQSAVRVLQAGMTQVKSEIVEIKDTLKDMNYRFKENDLRHDEHDERFKRLESQINPKSPPKSKQA